MTSSSSNYSRRSQTSQARGFSGDGSSSGGSGSVSIFRNSAGNMIKRAHVNGYAECMKFIAEYKDTPEPLFIIFEGSKLASGRNWCPDCEIGEAVVSKCLANINKDITVLFVSVGDIVYWKSLDNIFRKDQQLRLTNIPTIMEWKRKLKLEGQQALQLDIVQMFFEGDTD